jgi:hypothetical protein
MFKLIFCASFLVSPRALLLRDHLIKRVRECGTMEEDNNFFEFDLLKAVVGGAFLRVMIYYMHGRQFLQHHNHHCYLTPPIAEDLIISV